MKKGVWQQDASHHIKEYGSEFIESKYFGLRINSNILQLFKNFSNNHNGNCDIYEFGVYTGGTLRDAVIQLKINDIQFSNIYGFDSFEGLPQEAPNMVIEGDHWKEGAFSACDALGIWDWQQLHDRIIQTINYPKTTLIKGYFVDSLNTELLSRYTFNPAMFIHIDVDLYISTIQVLEWLVTNNLLTVGTVIRYDDVLRVPENTGELLAHSQICEKYNIQCQRLDKHYFIVESYEKV